VGSLARAHGTTPAQILFRLALELGMVPLTGTTDRAHMGKDLEAFDLALSVDEVASVLALGR
jgi:diketogulonate reductase-like aldo/keto reductase